MNFFVALIGLVALALIPIFLIVAIISLLRKKIAKKWFIAMTVSMAIFFICLFVPTCNHEWTDATCIVPKNCKLCDEIEGSPLGHDINEWSEWDADYDEAIMFREKVCQRCEEVIESETEDITSFVAGDHFTIYPYAFSERFDEQSARLNEIEYSSKAHYKEMSFYDEDNTIYFEIQDTNNDYNVIGMYGFEHSDGKTVAVMDKWSENTIGRINFLIEDSYDVAAVVYSAILAIDPAIGYSEAAEIGQKVVDERIVRVGLSEEEFQGVEYNGIRYLLYVDREDNYLIIDIVE